MEHTNIFDSSGIPVAALDSLIDYCRQLRFSYIHNVTTCQLQYQSAVIDQLDALKLACQPVLLLSVCMARLTVA
jgi:hypothetical protein